MFKAIQLIHKTSGGNIIVKDKQGNIAGNTQQKIKNITEHFSNTFYSSEEKECLNVQPCRLDVPFSPKEIETAIKSLKNNKSSGCDNLRAEHLKYAPSEILEEIAVLLNNVAETGNYPKEIKTGHLTPLQKPGKTKGPPENLRPVILLSTLRKILAICLIKRISGRLHEHIIPITETAYTSNRSTTEIVFTFKVLAEKAISLIGYETNLLMLDISKALTL